MYSLPPALDRESPRGTPHPDPQARPEQTPPPACRRCHRDQGDGGPGTGSRPGRTRGAVPREERSERVRAPSTWGLSIVDVSEGTLREPGGWLASRGHARRREWISTRAFDFGQVRLHGPPVPLPGSWTRAGVCFLPPPASHPGRAEMVPEEEHTQHGTRVWCPPCPLRPLLAVLLPYTEAWQLSARERAVVRSRSFSVLRVRLKTEI